MKWCGYKKSGLFRVVLLFQSDWVPRRQEGLKTIDQIHQEAEMEAIEEQKMIKAMAVTGGKSYGRDDKKKGTETAVNAVCTSCMNGCTHRHSMDNTTFASYFSIEF